MVERRNRAKFLILWGESDLNFFSSELTAFSEMNIAGPRSHDGRGFVANAPAPRNPKPSITRQPVQECKQWPTLGDHPPGTRIGTLQRLLDQLPTDPRTMCAFAQHLPERPTAGLAMEQSQHVPRHVLQGQTLR